MNKGTIKKVLFWVFTLGGWVTLGAKFLYDNLEILPF